MFDVEIEQRKRTIVYDHDQLLWHWKQENRPVRCATALTIYSNTTNSGITVTDDGLEDALSYKSTFGVFPEEDVHFVIGHSTPGRLVFDPPSCGEASYHGVCPDRDRNQLSEVFDPNATYTGTVLAHLNASLFGPGCCVAFEPLETRLAPNKRPAACYVRAQSRTVVSPRFAAEDSLSLSLARALLSRSQVPFCAAPPPSAPPPVSPSPPPL